MNPRINYTLVGAFVVVLFAALLAIAVWLGQDRRHQERLPYLTYFNESVAGLNERASVRYMGVPVGVVERITLDDQNEGRVRLELRIDPQVPIRTSAVATLQAQGITGLLFVEIEPGDGSGEPLITSNQSPAVIASKASRLLQITDALNETLQRFNQLADNLNALSIHLGKLTDDEMRQQMAELVSSVTRLSVTADYKLQGLDVEAYNDLAQALTRFSAQLSGHSERWTDDMNRLSVQLSESLEQMGSEISQMARDGQSGLRQISPLLQEMESLLELMRRDSQQLIMGPGTLPAGPGER